MEHIRVLIVDDHPLMSEALAVFVNNAEGMVCAGIASNGLIGIRMTDTHRPDIVLMDLQMPVMGGIEAMEVLAREHPEVKVIAMTTFSEQEHVVAALRAGATGYLVKDMDPGDIVQGIRRVYAGEAALAPAISLALVRSVREGTSARPSSEVLQSFTEREREVLQWLGRGLSNAEIARRIHYSEASVKANMTQIMTKLGVRDRVQTVIKASQLGLIDLSLDA
ncbi:response regulator [Georgenia faecalis]|uniref:Response regulator n=1 Tax=Georgenia faecalis TaxID=2483799 RepID=A0ABV9D7B8_9MICO|nr:response regulator transcription factor [Georgenia faecalis]